MKRKIGVTEQDIQEVAAKAVSLTAWLDTQATAIKTGETKIPLELIPVGLMVAGVGVSFSGNAPGAISWGGGCCVA